MEVLFFYCIFAQELIKYIKIMWRTISFSDPVSVTNFLNDRPLLTNVSICNTSFSFVVFYYEPEEEYNHPYDED